MSSYSALLRGSKTLLMGDNGSGKTYSLVTWLLADPSHKLVYLATETDGVQSIIEAAKANNIDRSRLFYNYILPSSKGLDSLRAKASLVGKLSYADLTSIKGGDKKDYQQYLEVLDLLSDFHDMSGRKLGPVDALDATHMFAFDGLSGLNFICLDLVAGHKPAKHEGDYGVAMAMESELIRTLINQTNCFVTVVCHLEKSFDQYGNFLIAPNALGKKLGPNLGTDFSDVVLAKRSGRDFFWTVSEESHGLKGRLLPFATTLQPSFVQIYEAWKIRRDFLANQMETITNG